MGNAHESPVGPVFIVILIFLAAAAQSKLLVSNATLGGRVYVLYEGEALQNETVLVKPPSGAQFKIGLWKNAAEFNASEEGKWKIVFRGENYSAIVLGEEGKIVRQEKNAKENWDVLLLFMLLIFACVFAFAAAVWKNTGKKEMEFYAENGKLVLRSVQELQEPAISDADGKVVWAAKKFDRAGVLEISLLEMKTPFCLRAKMHGNDICIWTGGKKAMEETAMEAGRNGVEAAKNANFMKKRLDRVAP